MLFGSNYSLAQESSSDKGGLEGGRGISKIIHKTNLSFVCSTTSMAPAISWSVAMSQA
jgi:hypothetical protein